MVGLIGKKLGMTQVFDDAGLVTPVTVIEIHPNVVLGERTVDKDGYQALVIAGGDELSEKRVLKPVRGQFGKNTVRKHIREFRGEHEGVEVGSELTVAMFSDTGYVDVVATSKGKGFQGVMKRHNFGGGRATHGSKFHRANGSTGMAATPSRVHKGTKMAGRMGHERCTTQNLRVVRIDEEKQVVLVKGAVPGPKGSMVIVSQAKKRNG
ncbi:MAG: 50S ribosomal protein L3 [Spirochaetaceae bacterium]|nr:MAG: 50S ribosomal protein L3 [Spirochaetaceae bacterium]